MQKNKEYLIQEIGTNLKALNEDVLPKISEVQKHMRDFHQNQVKGITSLMQNFRELSKISKMWKMT